MATVRLAAPAQWQLTDVQDRRTPYLSTFGLLSAKIPKLLSDWLANNRFLHLLPTNLTSIVFVAAVTCLQTLKDASIAEKY